MPVAFRPTVVAIGRDAVAIGPRPLPSRRDAVANVESRCGIAEALRILRIPYARKISTVEPSEKAAPAALDQSLADYDGDPRRVSVTGLSMGGTGAWHFAALHRGRFAAAVPVCGEVVPTGGDSIPAGLLDALTSSTEAVGASRARWTSCCDPADSQSDLYDSVDVA